MVDLSMCRCMYDRHDRAAARLHLAVARSLLHIMVFRYSGRPLILFFSTVHDVTALSFEVALRSVARFVSSYGRGQFLGAHQIGHWR
jgi:hypothetical protein